MLKRRWSCKEGVNVEDLYSMHPFLFSILSFLVGYCESYDLPCVVTSITDHAPGRVSRTHTEGRALDVSVNGWDELHIFRFMKQANEKFQHIAAISGSDLQPRAVVYHKVEGSNYHFHIQVRPELPGDYLQ